MMSRLKPGRGWLSVAMAALVTGGVAIAVPTLAADRPVSQPATVQPAALPAAQTEVDQRACLIVDTDVGLDDYRALAVLAPDRDVRAVVVTEGISGVQNGSTGVSMFLAARGATPPVIPGLASATPPDYDWLPVARAGAERINNYLHSAVAFGGDPDQLKHDVGQAVRGCGKVEVLVLGPWTSFLRYRWALGSNVSAVVSGRSFAENNPDNFNCEYDLTSCRKAVGLLAQLRSVVYVDLPAPGSDLTYDPTEAMVARFDKTGLPGLLRTALQVDPSQWLGTRLWDDAAALYLLSPKKFAPNGGHVEPTVSETVFRTLLVDAINAD